ncbi:aldo/keto reductase [Aquibaculum sediminis]|uniref:aldo/keto reductase n=1 Tax=Aquibaculum sediminis TaxID=3231907 RepID=UPI003453A7C4
MTADSPSITFPDGTSVPKLGLGTWGMGERSQERAREVRALQAGLDRGLTLVDTAEMYGSGGAEEVVGEAITGRRDSVFLVTKVLPHNASREGTRRACEASLRRMGTDRLDLYLLHWRGSWPLEETLEAFAALQAEGKIRAWGVSNLDMEDCQELDALPGSEGLATNQLLYNLSRRGIEADLLPWCQARGVPVMAYSPIEQGRLLRQRPLKRIAQRHEATAAQIALAWLLRQEGVLPIPKASDLGHLEENIAALSEELTQEDLEELDQGFPPPDGPQPLDIL